MSGDPSFSFDDVIERLDDINLSLRRIAAALETIAQSLNPEELQVQPHKREKGEQKRKVEKKTWKSYKELSNAIKEKAPTLHENLKNVKRFKSGDFLVQIEYVSNSDFKEIAREAEALGGEYSKKYRGFIFRGEA